MSNFCCMLLYMLYLTLEFSPSVTSTLGSPFFPVFSVQCLQTDTFWCCVRWFHVSPDNILKGNAWSTSVSIFVRNPVEYLFCSSVYAKVNFYLLSWRILKLYFSRLSAAFLCFCIGVCDKMFCEFFTLLLSLPSQSTWAARSVIREWVLYPTKIVVSLPFCNVDICCWVMSKMTMTIM